MDFNEYQKLAERTAKADEKYSLDHRVAYQLRVIDMAMGQAGEAGETLDAVKKFIFHGHKLDKEKIKEELCDQLWYISEMARVLGYSLDEIAEANVEKLRKRYPEGFSEQRSRERDE